jgi:hypothetical protein
MVVDCKISKQILALQILKFQKHRVICPRDSLISDLSGTITRLNVNYIRLTSSLLKILHPDQVPSLKTIIIGGG